MLNVCLFVLHFSCKNKQKQFLKLIERFTTYVNDRIEDKQHFLTISCLTCITLDALNKKYDMFKIFLPQN